MMRCDEQWTSRIREAYERSERDISPEVFQALARARNRALRTPALRFRASWVTMPALALLAGTALGIYFWVRLKPPQALPSSLPYQAQMLARGSPKLYEHLAFYRWLADHKAKKVG